MAVGGFTGFWSWPEKGLLRAPFGLPFHTAALCCGWLPSMPEETRRGELMNLLVIDSYPSLGCLAPK